MNAAQWAAAFRATEYRISLPTGVVVTRIDEVCAPLAAWMRASMPVGASVISARNPQAVALDEPSNLRRETALREILRAQTLAMLPAEGVSDDGQWREQSLFVPGLFGAACRAVMQSFDQLAWVEYDSTGLAQLRWTHDSIAQD